MIISKLVIFFESPRFYGLQDHYLLGYVYILLYIYVILINHCLLHLHR